MEVPGKAYNQTQSDPELNVSFDSSVPKEDTADNPTVIDDINKTGPNGRDDIEVMKFRVLERRKKSKRTHPKLLEV